MSRTLRAIALALLLTAASAAAGQSRGPADLANAPVPPGAMRINYGTDPLQFGELRLPSTVARPPVAIVVHGGCWVSELGQLDPRAIAIDNMRPMAAALTAAHVLVYSPAMGQSKKPRPRKSSAPKLVKWMIAAAVVVGIGYGVSQMSNIAYGEREIKVVDFSGLAAAKKREVLEAANAARCSCGCGMTLAQCIATDSTCPIRESNVDKLKSMVSEAARTKS